MRKLALYGAGGLGADMLDMLVGDGAVFSGYDEVFFVDDDPAATAVARTTPTAFPGLLAEAAVHDVRVAVAVGEPAARHRLASKVVGAGIELATIVGSDARVSPGASLGPGCVIAGGSIVRRGARLGANSLAIDAYVSGGCEVGKGSVLMPRSTLAAYSRVLGQALVGCGSVVGSGVTVGSRAVVEDGAVALEDVADGLVVRGNPAYPVESDSPNFYSGRAL